MQTFPTDDSDLYNKQKIIHLKFIVKCNDRCL